MGEQKLIKCKDCEVWEDIGKLHFPYRKYCWYDSHGWFTDDYNQQQLKTLISFMGRHSGHRLVLLGEYGGTQERWMNTMNHKG